EPGVNNGGNILLDYNTRTGDYKHKTAQGVPNTVRMGNLTVSYRLFRRTWVDLGWNYRLDEIPEAKKESLWFTGGIRMNLDPLRFDF
ncbi:MAG TPA: hypothetical protein VFX48_02370, partial [Saprospiraceae bacterium]|nr:hypothetical protein [Saprospiraceae bacterium]